MPDLYTKDSQRIWCNYTLTTRKKKRMILRTNKASEVSVVVSGLTRHNKQKEKRCSVIDTCNNQADTHLSEMQEMKSYIL